MDGKESHIKDFNSWNPAKIKLNAKTEYPFYKEREIWWCSLGVNVGTEQDGTGRNFDRPVLVIKGFNRSQFFGVALTGNRKEKSRWHVYLGNIGAEGDGSAILSQVRTVDARRLVKKMGTLDEKIFGLVVDRLRDTLFPKVP